jgi:hypothetical protein
MALLKKKIIYGCESRGEGQSPYLTRWTLWRRKDDQAALYLHLFHRSDADELHDHPWSFVSIILWRGYEEETPCPLCEHDLSEPGLVLIASSCGMCNNRGRVRKRVWPGMILFRPSTWVHRVELVKGRPALTLVFRTAYVRQWGFFTKCGWQVSRDYLKERGCE